MEAEGGKIIDFNECITRGIERLSHLASLVAQTLIRYPIYI